MNPTSVDDLKKQFAAEISAIEKKERAEGFIEGRASAGGAAPGVEVAERLAAKARALQAANPALTNLDAVRAVYAEEGIALG